MSTSEALVKALGAGAAKIDEATIEYICAIIDGGETDPDELAETIAPFILDAGCAKDEHGVRDIVVSVLEAIGKDSDQKKVAVVQKLANVINISKNAGESGWSDYKRRPEIPTYVDHAALKKAEEKMEKRQEKRAAKEAAKAEREKQKTVGDIQLNFSGKIHGPSADDPTLTGAQLSRDIRAENFSMAFGKLELLSNTTLMINYGRRYGLVGRNGCGKSTLMRYISRREVAYSPRISVLHVEQEVVGDDTPALQSVLAADVERTQLFEEEKELLKIDPGCQRLHQIYTRLTEIDAYGAESRASAILTGLSFTEEMKAQPTKSFSGGWRMRIALARALFCQPDLLLLDEPTNHLDFHAVVWLERFLTNWKKTLLIVSHQRDFLNNVATDIVHLYNKQLSYYKGNYDAFERVANERIQAQKTEFEAQSLQRSHIQKFIDRFRYNAKRASQVQSRLKMINKMSITAPIVEEGSVVLPFPDPEPVPPPVLQFIDVAFSFGPHEIFKNISLSLDMDSRVALVGPNGCGKTTFLRLLIGELEANDGHVERSGKLRFGLFSQHFVDMLDLNVSAVEYFHSKFPSLTPLEIRGHLGKYGISGDTALQTLSTLSGGQKSRVVFATIAYRQPHILLLDEPSNHLDIETIEGLVQSLTAFQGGVLMVSHDQRLISMVCDEVWHIHDGTVARWDGDIASYKRWLEDTLKWQRAH